MLIQKALIDWAITPPSPSVLWSRFFSKGSRRRNKWWEWESQIDSQWNDSVGIFGSRRLISPSPSSWRTDLSYWTHLVQHSLSLGPGRITAHASSRAHPSAQQNDCSTWAVISFIFFPQCQVPGSWCQGQQQHHCFATSEAGCMHTALCGSGWAPHAPLPGDSVSWFLSNRNICPVHTVLGDY